MEGFGNSNARQGAFSRHNGNSSHNSSGHGHRRNSKGRFRRPGNGQSVRPTHNTSAAHSTSGRRPPRGRHLPPNTNRGQSIEKLLLKYQNLLLQHHQARRKFFEAYNREKNQQKAEKQYLLCLKELRQFEQSLSPWQQEQFRAHFDPYPLDQSYTQHHPDQTAVSVSMAGEFPDPHLLPGQKAALWPSGDEESVGTMEDYQQWQNEKQQQGK